MTFAKPTAAKPAAKRAAGSVHCFKAGSHVALSGAVLAFAQPDLAATAAAYDPALHQAPLVVGHPKLDSPAYGWVRSLAADASGLEAGTEQVNPEFAALVNSGAYKKVSAAFWAPDAPGNPVPGVYYLRHVGFLGGSAPAVHGLRPPQFAGSEVGVVEFSDWDDVDNASLWRSVRDWILGKWGPADADAAVPAYLVASVERGAQQELADSLAAEAADADAANTTTNTTAGLLPAFAQPAIKPETTVTPEEKAALVAENARLHQQIADAAAAACAQRIDTARAEGLAFAAQLVGQDRLATHHTEAVGELFATVAAQEAAQGAVLQFGAGDARAPLLPVVRLLLGDLPVRVAGARVVTAARAAAGDGGTAQFAAPDGAMVDADSLATHQRVLAYQVAHPPVGYEAALAAVLAGQA